MTTTKLLVAFSHSLTEDQVSDAKKELGIGEIVLLKDVAPRLQEIFSSFPAFLDSSECYAAAKDLIRQTIKHQCDYLYFAGEPGITLALGLVLGDPSGFGVDFGKIAQEEGVRLKAFKLVQSTTERISKDIPQKDGTILKTSTFKHVKWRVFL